MKGLIFTYVLTYGGAAASLFNPFIGLLVYVAFSILRPEGLWHWSVPKGNYSRIVALALLVGWLARGMGTWEFGRAKVVLFALLGYFACAIMSALLATESDVAWGYVESQFKIVLPFVVGLTTITTVKQLQQLTWVIILSTGYLAFEFNLTWYGGTNPLDDDFAGMDNNCVAIAMDTVLGLAFVLCMEARRLWVRGVAFCVAAMIAHVVLFSFSRGGMLAMGIMGIATFLLIPKKPKHYLIFALAAVMAFRLAGPEVRERFFKTFADEKTRDASAESRIIMWGACRDAMVQHPVFGLGPDNFPLIMPQQYGYSKGLMAHSLWLQTGADIGIPGLLCLISFYGLCACLLLPLSRQKYPAFDPWLNIAARMVVASIIGFAFSAQFVSLHGLEVPYYVTMIGAGVLKVTSAEQRVRRPLPVRSEPRMLMPVAAVR